MGIKNGKYWNGSWNPIKLKSGGYYCTPISIGCKNKDEITCWANAMNQRFYRGTKFGTLENPEFVLDEKVLEQPLHWRKPRVIAVQWLGDLFHKDIKWEMINAVLDMANRCENHQFLFLTKRPQGMKEQIDLFLSKRAIKEMLSHVWLGTTICNQREANENIPLLLQIPGKHLLSIEPMLSRVHINPNQLVLINQVVVGAESGHRARPMNLHWVRRIRNDCGRTGVSCFIKQLHINGKLSKDMNEWPEDLRVRQLAWRRDENEV